MSLLRRSSSISISLSPSPEKCNHRRSQKTPMHCCRKKFLASTSRRKSRSPSLKRHSSRRSSYSRRSYSTDSDTYRHCKHPVSKTRHVPRRRSYSRQHSSSRRSRSNSSDCSKHRRHTHYASKRDHSPHGKFSGTRRRRGSSAESRDSYHHKGVVSVTKKREREEKKDSDVEVLDEKQPKKKRCRSRSVSKIKSETTNQAPISSTMYRYYEKAGKCIEQENFIKALKRIHVARKLCKKGDKFLSKIYSRRGTIHSLYEKPRCSLQGFLDWERAYTIDKDNLEARTNMSKVLFMSANKYYRKKIYEKALLLCDHALELNKNNGEAFILQTLLKKKLVEIIENRDTFLLPSKPEMNPFPANVKRKSRCVSSVMPESSKDDQTSGKIQRLIQLTVKTLENDAARAFSFIKQALKLYDSLERPDETVREQILAAKQSVMNMLTEHSTS